ncbi:hypothetical protein Tco_0371054 [Tanacetum coccineum]
MIGGLMYLTASQLNIAFATFICARYQAWPTEKHLKEVKRIFRYLRQSINMGLWYSKDSGFKLIAYSDADLTRDVLQLLVETPKNPFIILADLKYIPRFLKIVGYEGIVDKKKDLISYPHFTKLIIDDHIKKFPSISLRLKEDYHSIKDDVPLGSVYTTGNMIV